MTLTLTNNNVLDILNDSVDTSFSEPSRVELTAIGHVQPRAYRNTAWNSHSFSIENCAL